MEDVVRVEGGLDLLQSPVLCTAGVADGSMGESRGREGSGKSEQSDLGPREPQHLGDAVVPSRRVSPVHRQGLAGDEGRVV